MKLFGLLTGRRAPAGTFNHPSHAGWVGRMQTHGRQKIPVWENANYPGWYIAEAPHPPGSGLYRYQVFLAGGSTMGKLHASFEDAWDAIVKTGKYPQGRAWGRRAPAAFRIGKSTYEILSHAKQDEGTPYASHVWKLQGPDGNEHTLAKLDKRGADYRKRSRWSRWRDVKASTVKYLPAIAGERKKPARPKRPAAPRGRQTHDLGNGQFATVMPKKWIRLHGDLHNRLPKYQRAYDITFKIGDRAVYGSYNLVYTGRIVSIGPKTVTIEEDHKNYDKEHGRRHRLPLARFSMYNDDYDAQKIAERNHDTMMHI